MSLHFQGCRTEALWDTLSLGVAKLCCVALPCSADLLGPAYSHSASATRSALVSYWPRLPRHGSRGDGVMYDIMLPQVS